MTMPGSLTQQTTIRKSFAKCTVYERWRWQIFAVSWLAYAAFSLTRKPFSVAKLGVGPGTEIGLTQPQMAWIDGSFLIAYVIGQFVFGLAGNRVVTRKLGPL